MKFLEYNISTELPKLPVANKIVINTINPHSYCVAKKDADFKEALKSSDFLLPDGIGIVWAIRLMTGSKIKKIAGHQAFEYLMEYLNSNNESCFFLGASEKTLSLIKEKIRLEYKNIQVNNYSPPFKPYFSEEDNQIMLEQVNRQKPTVLFVGMTAPKQEKWVHQHKDLLNTSIICSIGAVFDFYAGTVKRAPNWMIHLGLEWLHRSIKNPKRLGKRNLKSNPEFVIDVLKAKLQ